MLGSAQADVSVVIGPTNIPRGDAVSDRDITIENGLFALAFAVDSVPPWGVARGGIVDIATIKNGEPGYDIASLVDFMPNNWSSWPTTYQRVTVEKATAEEAVIKTVRDWGEVELETTFRIRDRDSRIHLITRMTNAGEATLDGLLSGYVLWPDGGYLREEPVVSSSDAVNAPGGWTAAYDEGWLLGLHAPFSDYVTRRGRDRYTRHDLPPGGSRIFEAWLQIENEGSLAPMVLSEIEFGGLDAGRIVGTVHSTGGMTVSRPAVIASRDGQPFVWTLGEAGDYELTLPRGSYELYATAAGYARGQSRKVSITPGSETRVDFDDVRPPGEVRFDVREARTGRALDARIQVRDGYQPLIGYFGTSTFFTALEDVGKLSESLAPGRYVFEVSAGGGFVSMPQLIEIEVKSASTSSLNVKIPIAAEPRQLGWYSADLHHHSDVLDGFTEPEYVLRSELAAGIDVAFLSDHDSVINNEAMRKLAATREVPFIAGTELSPSWGHFNAYPLDPEATVDLDTGQATVQQIFSTARDMGADIVAVNHPYSEYGYFTSLEKNAAPGGWDDGFDLIEIGPVLDNKDEQARNRDTLHHTWRLWNSGDEAYLTAGSDVHDVWSKVSGRVRTYVHVEGDFSIEKFVHALKAGHAFVSQGPLVYPSIAFGSRLAHESGDPLELEFTVQAVAGLKAVRLIERGSEVAIEHIEGATGPQLVAFTVHPAADTWYSLIVEDQDERSAFTNPIWVDIAGPRR